MTSSRSRSRSRRPVRAPGRADPGYGRLAEELAAWRLRLAGLRVVGRNVRVGGREIDLVARRGGLLVVCEVKARRGAERGEPVEAVGVHKQRRLREAAEVLLRDDATVETVRFDVVEVRGRRVRHLPAAF
jgi:putative endonuclease